MSTSSKAIESGRLLLLPAHPSLAGAVTAYYLRNRDFLAPFDPAREPSFFTVRGQRALLRQEAGDARHGRACRFYLARKADPKAIMGLAALNGIVTGSFQSCFLSYKLDAAYLNQGYMTEAVKTVTDFAFLGLGLHRVEANIMPRNLPSLRVAEKAGFIREGLSPKYLQINGVWEDHIHMVRLADTP